MFRYEERLSPTQIGCAFFADLTNPGYFHVRFSDLILAPRTFCVNTCVRNIKPRGHGTLDWAARQSQTHCPPTTCTGLNSPVSIRYSGPRGDAHEQENLPHGYSVRRRPGHGRRTDLQRRAGQTGRAAASPAVCPTCGDIDPRLEACTVILVGKDASTDGSVMTTHTCDCGTCDWTWRHVPAADHKPGEMRKIYHISQYDDLAARRGPQVGPRSRRTTPASRSPSPPTPTATSTASSAT